MLGDRFYHICTICVVFITGCLLLFFLLFVFISRATESSGGVSSFPGSFPSFLSSCFSSSLPPSSLPFSSLHHIFLSLLFFSESSNILKSSMNIFKQRCGSLRLLVHADLLDHEPSAWLLPLLPATGTRVLFPLDQELRCGLQCWLSSCL